MRALLLKLLGGVEAPKAKKNDSAYLCGNCEEPVEPECIAKGRGFLCEDCWRGQPSLGDGPEAATIRRARMYSTPVPGKPGEWVAGPFRREINEWAERLGASPTLTRTDWIQEALAVQKDAIAAYRKGDFETFKDLNGRALTLTKGGADE